jgi:hypothetical protein
MIYIIGCMYGQWSGRVITARLSDPLELVSSSIRGKRMRRSGGKKVQLVDPVAPCVLRNKAAVSD